MQQHSPLYSSQDSQILDAPDSILPQTCYPDFQDKQMKTSRSGGKAMKQCSPVQCASIESPSQVKRFLFCKHYDTCLDYAVKKSWDNFSCEQCDCYERVRWDEEQWAEDYSRCLTLAYFVAFEKVKRQLQKPRRESPQAPVTPYPVFEPPTVVELT